MRHMLHRYFEVQHRTLCDLAGALVYVQAESDLPLLQVGNHMVETPVWLYIISYVRYSGSQPQGPKAPV